ncbi:CaiB/BaiF CoA-transferase family protein [Mycolicibacterium thermoresistibile]|uniref:L-carnitine dehydratase/bile acid-inducible protein F n=2 Tax=Mycolicibacterium thermoresistibile TaxID=1797 RepID=G7CEQ6_MYCT3|nr:CoA transferase [Mycolicibacterium thermoresistibile]EHI12985.1 L-carnitine dehydratase/bile acid-inducible protein F [Mycolicibacterium thermoresistibile ATCC 19527]MCV7190383.1 CoA transferase [Mycolicibacterium thermoresistibile]GAT15843.1 L-carnitine dehydratase/bile acid-inducible protein F [Mycolicibacterium thermoresistibile]SNW19506.1 L-carnitine dehydratase/bile acid-inducible protein F [Mycolicibacterium thermoresistibile]
MSSAETVEQTRAVYDGLRVIDLTQGIAGAISTMLLADAGAEVVRIDLPADPFADLSGYRVWHRGKKRVTLDPAEPADRDVLAKLIASADVLVDAVDPVPDGLDLPALTAGNPALVRCSISGYGEAAGHQGRKPIEALVAARTGLHWEARGIPGTTIGALSGWEDPLADVDLGPGTGVGPDRPGPMYLGIPWASNATAYLAAIGISAALRVREISGRGQHLKTSLLQGVLCAGSIAWQRVENPYAEGYLGWTTDPRAPKGFYRTADGRWIQQWVQLPGFMLGVSEGDEIVIPESGVSPKDADLRISTDYHDMVMLGHFHPEMAAAAAKFPAADWERAARTAGVPLEIVRSPEEALLDESLLADGCVREFKDEEYGAIRAVGDVVRLSRCPATVGETTYPPGSHNDWVRSVEDGRPAKARSGESESGASRSSGANPPAPLAGIRVLDLGLAIAGPFGAQVLAALGADVIRVSSRQDETWMRTQYSHMSNRGKRSVVIDLKSEEGKVLFEKLVATADVVHHNMRESAARKLRVDSASLRKINPRLIYCHTRGYERGERETKPANDQTGAALAGTEWVDGAADNGGTPIWPSISLGDTGNGLLSAIGVLQALYHRDRTGEGQDVDTSIVYAHLVNASMAWVTPDGEHRGDRPVIDAGHWGISALERIYPAARGWLCLSVTAEPDWQRLVQAIPELADERFADDDGRRRHQADLADTLTRVFGTDTATAWQARLEAYGVPAEALPDGPAFALFDDPDLKNRGLIESYVHPELGRMEMAGRLIDIDGVRPLGRAPVHGEHTRQVLTELGLSAAEIDHLVRAGVVVDTPVGDGAEAR